MYFVVKILTSAVLIALISTIAKRSTFFGALTASLPITSLLALVWMYQENKDVEPIAAMSFEILWLVIPSMAFFVVLPFTLRKGLSFYPSLLIACAATIVAYFFFIKVKSFV